MSVKYALLGLLLDQPAYPYQLASRLQERLGPAWEVNSGQLYQTIKSLERAGLIELVESVPADETERRVFRITEDGLGELDRFFQEAPEGVRLTRRPLLLKIAFAGPRRLYEAQEKLDAYERECARRLEETFRRRDQLPAEERLLRADWRLLRLSLSADVFQLEAELHWARQAREMLVWLISSEATWPSGFETGGVGHRSRR